MSNRCFPLKKEKRDLRDYHFMSTAFNSPEELPKKVDLRSEMSPVVDQGSLGSCTANAIASGLREYLLLSSQENWTELSRLFLYWHERQLEGHINEDSGAYIRDGMKVLQKIGVCPEEDYPYILSEFRDRPVREAELHAANYRINDYHRISDLHALKAALAEGLPVVIGMQLYESFQSADAADTGKIPAPKKSKERVLGGHAMLAVGYVDRGTSGHVIVRNSWGAAWGDHGYCYMPYKMFQDPDCLMDMWTGK
ncbi:C1 family peptidase [Paenibacillus roseipurpureus]|uniref:C1 family peptidase n=1 Tax=Paenibacillus roseopurpureus TaxID=2918901 RepID=A0AA96LML4_9BACL|nr:C1 family peptidase [Paenibacillus sp. MBLB1832]WNR43887.1 C1 family peptidase [Paenibacillus sp. MBLB1832]